MIRHHRIPRSLIFWKEEETETLSPKEHSDKHGRIYEMLKEMGFDLSIKIQITDNSWLGISTYPPDWRHFPARALDGYLWEEKDGKRIEIVGGKVNLLPAYSAFNATVIEVE